MQQQVFYCSRNFFNCPDLEAKQQKQKQEEEAAKRAKREEVKRQLEVPSEIKPVAGKRRKNEDGVEELVTEQVDPEMAAMGLPTGFGTTKKS